MCTVASTLHACTFTHGTVHCMVQWNPYSGHPGEQHFGCYIGVAFIEGLFCTQHFHLGPEFLARYIGVPLYIVHLYNILLSIIKLS